MQIFVLVIWQRIFDLKRIMDMIKIYRIFLLYFYFFSVLAISEFLFFNANFSSIFSILFCQILGFHYIQQLLLSSLTFAYIRHRKSQKSQIFLERAN